MRNQEKLNKISEINRKNFFSRISKGFLGFIVVSSFPFNLFAGNSSSKKIQIKINPLAVKRTKDNNG